MSVFRSASRVVGHISPILESFVARGLNELVSSLIVSSLVVWRESGFTRFDDHEINCTVQVYRCALLAQDADASLRVLRIQLEWVQPTPDMLAGATSSSSMRRPDLRIGIGRSAAWTIECKRLKQADGLPNAYVDEGLARFVSGDYGACERFGAMIGYVQAGDPQQIVLSVNERIDGHPLMGAGHRLVEVQQVEMDVSLHLSQHARAGMVPILIEHHHADLR